MKVSNKRPSVIRGRKSALRGDVLPVEDNTLSTGHIRYALAQVLVAGGLVYGLSDFNPYVVAGSAVLCSTSSVWFVCRQLRRVWGKVT